MVAGVSKPARVGILAVLAGAVAIAAGYVNNCFTGLGLGPGAGASGQADVSKKKDDVKPVAAPAKVRVIVQGEHCRMDGEAATQKCDDLCRTVKADAVDVEATVGAQGTVDSFKACLIGRGLKVQVLSE
jgi:hypothetical protein